MGFLDKPEEVKGQKQTTKSPLKEKQVVKKPKEKQSCPYCSKQYANVDRHLKTCTKNPENQKAQVDETQIIEIISDKIKPIQDQLNVALAKVDNFNQNIHFPDYSDKILDLNEKIRELENTIKAMQKPSTQDSEVPIFIKKKLLVLLKSEYSKWKNRSGVYIDLIDEILDYFKLFESFEITREQFNKLKMNDLRNLTTK